MSSMLIEREPLDVVTVASEAAGEGPRAQLSVREKGDDIKVPSINSYFWTLQRRTYRRVTSR